MAMGVPGWPELAAWTASMARVRMVLMAVCSTGLVPASLAAWGAAGVGCVLAITGAPFQRSTSSRRWPGAAAGPVRPPGRVARLRKGIRLARAAGQYGDA